MRILFFVALTLTGCPPAPPPDPPPQPELDAGTGTCDSACSKLRALGCEEGKATGEGATCETVCLNVQNSGVISWNLGCRSSITTCAQVDACD